jgi:hypothetical protein
MKRKTKAALSRVINAEWFFAVGKPAKRSVFVVSSWSQAVKSCVGNHWLGTITEAFNLLIEEIIAKSVKRFNKWNDLSDELRAFVIPHVKEKIAPIVKRYNPPERFEQIVVLMISGLGMEEEYADLVSPGFCKKLADWFIKGHLPCGWKGDYPKGKLVIY